MSFIIIDKSVQKNNWSMKDLHSHSHYEIYYLYKGERTFFLENNLHTLTSPCLIIIPPHTMHKTEGGAFERYNIDVSPQYLNQFQTNVLQSGALLCTTPNEEQNKMLLSLIEEMELTDTKLQWGEDKLHALFSYFILCLNKIKNEVKVPLSKSDSPIPPIVLRVMNYLNTHYSERITLDSLSELFFVSKGSLIYNFKKYTNCSPIDFLLNIRLTKAKEQLSTGTKTIEKISDECGFSSANYFSLMFKKKEHMSPAYYRKYQKSKK